MENAGTGGRRARSETEVHAPESGHPANSGASTSPVAGATALLLRRFRVDLHVHSVLSPCAELEMGAREIVRRASREGIALLALTDHNAVANVPALAEAAEAERERLRASGVDDGGIPRILCGVEVQTEEDIHLVALFRSAEDGFVFQEWLWKSLPSRANDPDIFGYQLIIDGKNAVLDQVETLLVQGVSRSVDEVIAEIRRRGGLSFLAHVDRPGFSYVAVLGSVPEDLAVDAVELSRRLSAEEALVWRDRLGSRTILRSSDAHRLEDLRREHCMELLLAEPTFDEVALALRNEAGRCVLWPWEETPP
ncbi:PHP domain-containing protein [Aminiphilus circumscriptus]|jgi:predicted metal-dependent phosphoesterase TrpH|uniref:PHP domain-containing protein n=1 Tax=Aminiphilus circumscriptus TaxID=290732 RepID=UPI0004B6AF6B|nr:PHP domain-containing protein [Aminiphilus circumscriptus]